MHFMRYCSSYMRLQEMVFVVCIEVTIEEHRSL